MEIERTRGDTRPDIFTLTDSETWEPVNLAGCTFLLTVDTRAEPDDSSTQVYQLTGTSPEPIDGKIEFAPTAEQADLVGMFYFDVQLTDGLGVIQTIASGPYVYKQDITK